MKLTQTTIVCLALLAMSALCGDSTFCWKDSYGRGAGSPLSQCPTNTERGAADALCYPSCSSGFYGVGPVCWASCASGYKDTGTQCEKQSYGRTAGRPVYTCPAGYQKDGALCYPNCAAGYYGVGPVCWQSCSSGWTDTGALCQLWADTYGKSCCCFFGSCCRNCRSGYTDMGCTCTRGARTTAKSTYGRGAGIPLSCGANEDLDGGLCYPKCSSGFTGVGPVCWSGCPANTVNAGAVCTKNSYGRTAGVPMICKSTEQQGGALCYPYCSSGYTGVGPVCWGGCPSGWVQCGAACGKNQSECAGKIIDMVQSTAEMVTDIAGLVSGVGAGPVIAKKVAKVAEKVAKVASYAAKLNDMISKIMATDSTISQAEAKDRAQTELAGIMMFQKTDDIIDATWEIAAEIDPTGVLAAAKAFYYPLCSKV